MTELKSQKGITLINVVIMIILVLIISTAIIFGYGEKGIVENVNNAVQRANVENIKGQIRTDIIEHQISNKQEISEEGLKNILKQYGELSDEENIIDKTLTIGGKYPIKVSEIINEVTKESENVQPTFTTVANPPDITNFDKNSTYYVSWNLDNSPYIINDETLISKNPPNNWYDYTEGVNHWANVKTIGGGNECYWVWIPRYAYKVPQRNGNEQKIEIKFLKDDTKVAWGESVELGKEWLIHPAFTQSGNGGLGELTGIWVAKFEASSNHPSVLENPTEEELKYDGGAEIDTDLKVRVKPNVISWRSITLGDCFTVCKNLTKIGNSLENTTNIDSHIMKNTEWGMVAYLSSSGYGKKGRIYNNPYYINNIYLSSITGLCGEEAGYITTTYNDSKVYKYNTEKGINASTTGNVYGIYDMAGGSWEYVAGIYSKKISNSPNYDMLSIDAKYYDTYTRYGNSKYGDAIYETSTKLNGTTSWNSNFSNFVNSGEPVFVRGGRAGHGENAGIFAFSYDKGGAIKNTSFRPCLTINHK